MASNHDPVPVTARELINTLRKEAAGMCATKQMRDLMADIAARDLVERGRVRLVSSPGLRPSA